MYRKLRPGNSVFRIVLISCLLPYSSCYFDEEKFKYCGWDDDGRCPKIDDTYWECLKKESNCMNGKQYHCARHFTDRSKILDGCAESKKCLPGEAPYLDDVNHGEPTNELHVTCAECHDKEHFNDMIRNSSTYSQCYQKTKCDPLHGIECNETIKKNPKDVYSKNRECRCDTFENYMFSQSSDGKICTSDPYLARSCRKVKSCENGMERLQNGTCVQKCTSGHRTRYFDKCVEDPETTTSSQNPPSTHSNAEIPYTSQSTSTPQTVITTHLSTTIQGSTTDKPDPNFDWKVIALLALAVIIVFLVILIIYCVKKRCCQGNSQSGGEELHGMEGAAQTSNTDGNDTGSGSNQQTASRDKGPALRGEESEQLLSPSNGSSKQTAPQDEVKAVQDGILEQPLLHKTYEQDVRYVVSEESERLLSPSNGRSKQTAPQDEVKAVPGQTVVYEIRGNFINVIGTKNVKLSTYGNGNQIREKTTDNYQKVGNEPTTTTKNQRTEIMNDTDRAHEKENKENSNESSTKNFTKMLTDGSESDLFQKGQASCDKLADQSNIPEGQRKEFSPAITDTDLFQDMRNAVNDLNPLSLLRTLSSKSNFEAFLKEVTSIDRLLQSFQDINTYPDISSEFYESDQNKFCPKGFQRLTSTGDGNCLFNSISILLFGDENFARYLRLVATIAAAKNWKVLRKDALAKNASGESEADITDKVYKDIMSTAVDKEYMDRPHVQFLSIAIKRRIVQHYQNQRLVAAITGDQNQDMDTVYPIFSERDGNEDRNKDLHILWVNSDGDTRRGEDHIVPLLIKGNFSH